MASIDCIVRVKEDGSVTLSEEALQLLDLHPGDEVQVSVHKKGQPSQKEPSNPLYGIIGIGKAGRADGAENHDAYLYRDEAH
jgi:hypothetical protein